MAKSFLGRQLDDLKGEWTRATGEPLAKPAYGASPTPPASPPEFDKREQAKREAKPKPFGRALTRTLSRSR